MDTLLLTSKINYVQFASLALAPRLVTDTQRVSWPSQAAQSPCRRWLLEPTPWQLKCPLGLFLHLLPLSLLPHFLRATLLSLKPLDRGAWAGPSTASLYAHGTWRHLSPTRPRGPRGPKHAESQSRLHCGCQPHGVYEPQSQVLFFYTM